MFSWVGDLNWILEGLLEAAESGEEGQSKSKGAPMRGFSQQWRRVLKLDSLVLAVALLASQELGSSIAAGYSTELAPFAVQYKGDILPYRINSVFVLPEEMLAVQTVGKDMGVQPTLEVSAGKVTHTGANKWSWQAPRETGLYSIRITSPGSSDGMILNVFVMAPYNRLKGEYLNGYRIGNYPTIPLKQLAIYRPPKGFIEVTMENEETFLTPHFQLKQFSCKQESGFPKFVVLNERLLLKLEAILERVNKKGIPCNTFQIMSGFRTPYYNRLIGNGRYSCHLWGNAADIFIDENPKDGAMDDLNRDGKSDYRDAEVIYKVIDEMYGKPFYGLFIGGLAKYNRTSSHGPFVHVDVRGFRARW